MSEIVECQTCDGTGEVELSGKGIEPCPACTGRELHERIAALTAERDALKADNTTFLRALTEEDAAVIYRVTSKIIAARTVPADLIAVQQERIAALEGMLAENKRVLEIAMGTVARLSAPVSDAEWLDLCAGDALQITDVQRHELDRFIAARTVPLAPQDTEKDGEESQTAIDAVSEAQ